MLLKCLQFSAMSSYRGSKESRIEDFLAKLEVEASESPLERPAIL
jgi:hypothetical protein